MDKTTHMKVGPLNNDYTRGYLDGKKAGVTAENERAQPIIDALDQFISYHETGLLPARHVYENAVAARQQFKDGKKKVGDDDFEKWKKENVIVMGEFDFILGQKRIYGKRELRSVYEYLTNPTK